MSVNKEKVVALLKSIETGDSAPVAFINPTRYRQHNLSVGDGLAGFGAVLAQLPKGSAKVNTVRVFEDGDFVFAHTEYNFFGPKIGFDVFRFEDGLIVEHWDNLQETPASVNPSGRTMTDGPNTRISGANTAESKALVGAFIDDVLIHGRTDKLTHYLSTETYHQHNPSIADGIAGLGEALAAMAKAGITMQYSRTHKILGEGDFVLAMSEGLFGGKPVAFYDLFRVAGGRIVEHWDVIEVIPPEDQWSNRNGKF
jgi:predicted SnoaL-like aldol condensation-catalyzing enzyme